jgi:LPPG:FO 2-phospho-L-lactate transferase
MLKNGKSLGDITKWLCEKFAIEAKIIPVTDNTIETRVSTDEGEMHLQEFWVKHRGRNKVEGIQYIGSEKARPSPEAINAIQNSKLVIIAPANPYTSIGPVLAIKAIRKELMKNRRKVVAISPIIGNAALSGPAAKYMESAGNEVSAYGVAKMYANICSRIVIDTKDRMQTKKIEALNMQVYDTKIRMTNKKTEDALASFILKQVT